MIAFMLRVVRAAESIILYVRVAELGVESLIGQMERNSGVPFYEAQVALARQWITDDTSHDEYVPTEVDIRVPQETTEGLVVTDKTPPKLEKFPIPATMAEATQKIERFEAGAKDIWAAKNVSDNVVQHMLHDVTNLNQEQWDGTEEEELNWCALSIYREA